MTSFISFTTVSSTIYLQILRNIALIRWDVIYQISNATVSSLVESPQSSAALVIAGAIFKKFPHVSFAHLDTLIH